MKNSASAQQCAQNSCNTINRLTGLNMRLAQRADKGINLLCDNNPLIDSWKTWEEARVALWSSAMIVDAAFLKNTLLADSAGVERKLALAEKKLADTSVRLETALIERSLCLQAAALFARCIEPGTD